MTSSKAKIRPRNSEQTKEEILAAARCIFSRRGYAQAGLREIAAEAGITPALVIRYFENKENLFAVAMESFFDLQELLAGGQETFGRDMVAYINTHRHFETNPLSMQLLAISDPSARKIVTRLLRDSVLKTLSQWLGQDHAEVRASLITTVLSGVWIYCDLLPLDAFDGPLSPEISQWLEKTLQELATGPLPEKAGT